VARAACQEPHLFPVSFSLLKVRSPPLIATPTTGYTTVPVMRSFFKSAFLRAMLIIIIKTDRSENYTYIERNFIKLTRDIKNCPHHEQDSKWTRMFLLVITALYIYDKNRHILVYYSRVINRCKLQRNVDLLSSTFVCVCVCVCVCV